MRRALQISICFAFTWLALIWPGMAVAACAMPHQLANGQIADATKVMDDLNAVANCADSVVAATGSPTTGSLPVFSGPSSITSGNLSGDVTTSGGSATALSNTGVTAGSYTNPTLTVDSKGRITAASTGSTGGGGYGPIMSQTADGSSSSITFTGIPQNYRDLILVVTGQGVNAAQDVACYANGNTNNSNYRNATWNRFGNGSVTVPRIGTFPGLGVPSSGSAANMVVQFLNYSSSVWKKNAISDNQYEDTNNFFRGLLEWKWNNTSPITSIILKVMSGNIASGSVFTLYVR